MRNSPPRIIVVIDDGVSSLINQHVRRNADVCDSEEMMGANRGGEEWAEGGFILPATLGQSACRRRRIECQIRRRHEVTARPIGAARNSGAAIVIGKSRWSRIIRTETSSFATERLGK
jgi:hypothetical protein